MDKLLLVNKQNPIKKEIAKDLIIVPKEVSTIPYDRPYFKLNRETYNAFINLRKDILKYGIELLVDDGYRSFEYQKQIYERFKKEKGEAYANKIVAPIGSSEHHTGLAIDLSIRINDKILEDNDELFDQLKIFKKIEPFFYRHGFILRYPEGKEEITGYPYEPWHIRYIGKENSHYMKENNIETFEEFYTKKIKQI